MDQWVALIAAMLGQAVLLTAFFYREFATKKDVAQLDQHLREVASQEYRRLADQITQLHSDVRELQTLIKERMQWKQ